MGVLKAVQKQAETALETTLDSSETAEPSAKWSRPLNTRDVFRQLLDRSRSPELWLSAAALRPRWAARQKASFYGQDSRPNSGKQDEQTNEPTAITNGRVQRAVAVARRLRPLPLIALPVLSPPPARSYLADCVSRMAAQFWGARPMRPERERSLTSSIALSLVQRLRSAPCRGCLPGLAATGSPAV
eukprot:354792-Chlamydomonas_euryale.AAC.11